MPAPPNIMRNLVLMKEVYYRGKRAQQEGTPIGNLFACHHYDIAVEFLLRTLCTHFSINIDRGKNFFEIWEAVNGKYKQVTGTHLPLKPQIQALRDARNAVQHNGTYPHDLALEDFASHSESLISIVISQLFSISGLSEIRLSDLINNENVRKDIQIGIEKKESSDLKGAIECYSKAFFKATDKMLERLCGRDRNMILQPFALSHLEKSVNNEVKNEVEELFKRAEDLILFVSLDTDISRLRCFQQKSFPVCWVCGSSEPVILSPTEYNGTINDVEECEEFVISEIIRWGL